MPAPRIVSHCTEHRGAHLDGACPEIPTPSLINAARAVVWKLSHSYSASGRGDDCRPASIDRNDATVRDLEAAIAREEAAS